MLVFFSQKPLQIHHKAIDSEAQKISPYHNGYQTLTIAYEYPNGTIILKSGTKQINVNYGFVMGAKNPFPPVEKGKKYCFQVNEKGIMDYEEKKDVDKKMQTITENDALIILHVYPVDMNFSIKQEPYLQILNKPEKQKEGIYYLLVKPNTGDGAERKITIQKNDYADLTIPLGKVFPKDYRVFNVKDENFKGSKVIIKSIPPGGTLKINELDLTIKSGSAFEVPSRLEYHFKLTKPGYHEYNGTFTAVKENMEITVKLIPKKAYLTIPVRENSLGAQVFVDEKYVGTIPLNRFEVLEGEHRIKLAKDGYFPDKKSYNFQIKEGEEYTLTNYTMFRGGKVEVKSFPEQFAEIYVDGKETGEKTNTEIFLPEGSHTVQIKKEGFLPAQKRIYVSADNSNIVIINMKVDEKYRHNKEKQEILNKWMELSEQGDPDAMYQLAQYYKRKYGGNQEYQQKVLELYTRSANAGYVPAQRELALHYKTKGENRKAFYWFKKMAEQGDPHAQYIVGEMYRTGEGVTKSKKEAKYWWRLSCSGGYQPACQSLQNLGKFWQGFLGVAGNTLGIIADEAVKQTLGSDNSRNSNYNNSSYRSNQNSRAGYNYYRSYNRSRSDYKKLKEKIDKREKYLRSIR